MANDEKTRNADFVGRVVGDPKNPTPIRLLTGWFGDSGEEGYRRVYTDPELTTYVDIPADAILHTEPIRDSQPPGAVWVWVKADAAVKQGGTAASRAARFLQGQVQQDFSSPEKAGFRCVTQPPCGEPTGFTGQCTKQPEVGGGWPCITAIPHCAEPTGFTGKCTEVPWPNPSQYYGCTYLHCPTHDLTCIPQICQIVAGGGEQQPAPAQAQPAGGDAAAAAPATNLPGCGYTKTWGLCETHLLGCGYTKDGPRCPTYPNGDCTFFGCGPQQAAAGGQVGAGFQLQASAICATNIGCNITMFCPTRFRICIPPLTRFQPQCFPIPSPWCPVTPGCPFEQFDPRVNIAGGGFAQFGAPAAQQQPGPISVTMFHCCNPSAIDACPTRWQCPTPATQCTQGGPECATHNSPQCPTHEPCCTNFGPHCPTSPQQECTWICTQFEPNCPQTPLPQCINPTIDAVGAAQPAAAGGGVHITLLTIPVWQCRSPLPWQCGPSPLPWICPPRSPLPWLCPPRTPFCPPFPTLPPGCGGGPSAVDACPTGFCPPGGGGFEQFGAPGGGAGGAQLAATPFCPQTPFCPVPSQFVRCPSPFVVCPPSPFLRCPPSPIFRCPPSPIFRCPPSPLIQCPPSPLVVCPRSLPVACPPSPFGPCEFETANCPASPFCPPNASAVDACPSAFCPPDWGVLDPFAGGGGGQQFVGAPAAAAPAALQPIRTQFCPSRLVICPPSPFFRCPPSPIFRCPPSPFVWCPPQSPFCPPGPSAVDACPSAFCPPDWGVLDPFAGGGGGQQFVGAPAAAAPAALQPIRTPFCPQTPWCPVPSQFVRCPSPFVICPPSPFFRCPPSPIFQCPSPLIQCPPSPFGPCQITMPPGCPPPFTNPIRCGGPSAVDACPTRFCPPGGGGIEQFGAAQGAVAAPAGPFGTRFIDCFNQPTPATRCFWCPPPTFSGDCWPVQQQAGGVQFGAAQAPGGGEPTPATVCFVCTNVPQICGAPEAAAALAARQGGFGVTAWLDCTQFGPQCGQFFTLFEVECQVIDPWATQVGPQCFTIPPQCPRTVVGCPPPPPTPGCPTPLCPPQSPFVACTAFGPQCGGGGGTVLGNVAGAAAAAPSPWQQWCPPSPLIGGCPQTRPCPPTPLLCWRTQICAA